MAPTEGYAAEAPAAAFVEKTKDELAALTKEERTAYHKARTATAKAAAAPAQTLTKEEKKVQAREKQDADRKKKEDAKALGDEDKETYEELRLQGLTEDQAKQVLKEMKEAKPAGEDEEESDDEDESLVGSVRTWMGRWEGDVDKDAIRDFNLKVRFQGHVDSTPPDHLASILEVIASDLLSNFDLAAAKQPSAVSTKAEPMFEKWSTLLEQLLEKIDELAIGDIVVNTLRAAVTASAGEAAAPTKDCASVGLIMALREAIEVDDATVLTACKKVESDSKVWLGFVSHLEEAVAGSGSDSSDEE